jgi:hypothetical protein
MGENMTTFEILQIIIGTGIIGLLFKIIFQFGKLLQRIEAIKDKLDSIHKKIDKLEIEVRSQGERIARIEGFLHWYDRITTIDKAK